MKKTIAFLRVLLVAGFLFGLSGNAGAQTISAMGSDLTYVNIAPNTYVVQFGLYRDCSGAAPGLTQVLNYRAAGCDTTSRATLMNRIGTPITGDPYCHVPAPPCNGTGSTFSNYQKHTYSGTIMLPSLCTNWILSVGIANRQNSRNLVSGQSFLLYSEALINNVATQTNNSPAFSEIPILFVCVNQPNIYSHGVTDAENDSLVYSLVPALISGTAQAVYTSYPAVTNAVPPMQNYPAGTFSPINPIISRNPLAMDRLTGAMVFEPLDFKGPAFASSQGLDKHTLALQVDEYRKINGVPTKIGHVRREMMIVVVDCTPVCTPFLFSPAQPIHLPFVFQANVNKCYTFSLTVCDTTFSNGTFGDITGRGPRYTISGAGTNRTLTLCWRPTTADIGPQPYRFSLILDKVSCPIPGFVTFTIDLKVEKFRISDPGPVVIADPNQPGEARQAIPNIITPNGDGINDAFVIPNLPENAELQIFDRKHRTIRTFKGYRNNWNAEGLKDGVYFYILKDKATGEVTKGKVTVVR